VLKRGDREKERGGGSSHLPSKEIKYKRAGKTVAKRMQPGQIF